MGVDFFMDVVKLLADNKFEKVEGNKTDFMQTYSILAELFDPKENKKIRSLLKKKCLFDWFNKAHEGHYDQEDSEASIDNCWNPAEILNDVRAVYTALRTYSSKHPPFYWLSKRKDLRIQEDSSDIFYNGIPYYVKGGSGKCIARPEEEHIPIGMSVSDIDLSNLNEFECNDYLKVRNEQGKREPKEGPKIKLYIIRESDFKRFRNDLEQIEELCKFARDNGYLVFTYCE
jgi:hypothetical protein